MRHRLATLGLLYDAFGFRSVAGYLLQWLTGARVISVRVPQVEFPLRLRRNSSDVKSLLQVFRDGDCAFAVETSPRLVVDGGANVGFTSVAFASRWPNARIIALEPDEGNFAMLKANCLEYPNVVPVRAAICLMKAWSPLRIPRPNGGRCG